MTAHDLGRAVIGYSTRAVRVAGEGGLRECPAHDSCVPGMAALVTHWLTDPDAREWFLPPLSEDTIAAIH